MMLLLALGTAKKAGAQHLVFLFAHGQYASPLDKDFKNNYSYGLGAEGGVGLGTGSTFFMGTIGYSYFKAMSGKDAGNLTFVPIKVGVRHYLLVGKILFIDANAGIGAITNRATHTSESRFTADAGAGVKLGPLDLGINYEGFSRSDPSGFASWLAFKLGWRIGF